MKAIQAPVILIIKRIIQLGQAMIKITLLLFIHLNKVLQKFSTAQPSLSVAKHKLLRDTKKQQDVITSNRAIMTS
jgi:hypothetical protein